MKPLEDVSGECNARLYLGDDYGDSTCTCRCTRVSGHQGPHREHCRQNETGTGSKRVIIMWHGDDRIPDAWHDYRNEKYTAAGEPDDWEGWDEEMPANWDWKAYLEGSTSVSKA